jgi:hypothetical protein
MTKNQTEPINVNIIESITIDDIICGCCKDIIEKDDLLNTTISCGHQYHYDCIYNAFLGNQKRGKLVLECPYCRKKVSPLQEMDGFTYNSTIHGGLLCYGEGNLIEYKWAKQHQGIKYCAFCKDGKYCNYYGAGFGLGKKYCWKHHKSEHLGPTYCKMKSKDVYCNMFVEPNKEYCFSHKEFINVKYCKYNIQHGNHKGDVCNKYTFDESGLCLSHLKYKDKINIITAPKQIISKTPCTELIKTGIRKGNTCGVLDCHRHKKTIGVSQQVNKTKVIELKGIEEKPVVIYVEKSTDELSSEPIILDSEAVSEIKSVLIDNIYPSLSDEYKQILELMMTKYFK